MKILAESPVVLPMTLGDIADAATKSEAVRLKVEVFFAERLEFYLREARGQAYDVVKAVLAVGANDVRDAIARAEAVTAVRGREDFAAVSAAFKRMKNILAQAKEKGDPVEASQGASTTNAGPEEIALLAAANDVHRQVALLRESHDYVGALEKIATLRPAVDAFFERVMVMDPDPAIRKNRLAMLSFILAGSSQIADFSEIVTAG